MKDERELIMQCINRDIAAQNSFYTRLAPKMFPVCRRFARNGTDARDILQNGFMRVFSHLQQYRFEGSLEGWVRRIIVNTAINASKNELKINHEVDVEFIPSDMTRGEDPVSKLSEQDILALIQNLPHSHWKIFRLHEIEGYGHKEISAMLGIPEGTSKSQLQRGKAAIRRKMVEMGMG